MQTKDHKMLVKFLISQMGIDIPCLYKRAFILGSIEPDKNPFTYLHGLTCGVKFHGHNYENVLSVMKKLFVSMQKQEHFGVWGYYHLGKLTHYVADAFTFPHNGMFYGNLIEHCKYESMLHEEMPVLLLLPVISRCFALTICEDRQHAQKNGPTIWDKYMD